MAKSSNIFAFIAHKARYSALSSRTLIRHQHIKTYDNTHDNGVDPHEAKLDPFSRVDHSVGKMAFIDNLAPPLKRSFNLAAYVNQSETLQQLVKTGVSLFDIENTNFRAAKHLIQLDFGRDCMPYIRFLVENGVKARNIGRFISEYPDIFQVPLDDLKIRVKYLEMKGFSKKQIVVALNTSRHIISHTIKTLDHKLGELQIEFQMPAGLIRKVVSKYPPIVSLPSHQYKLINFALSQEFGFKLDEVHKLIGSQPQIMDMLRPHLLRRLEAVHNEMKFSHETICKFPELITSPSLDLRHRFLYLQKLKRNQFDPNKPLYVPPPALYEMSDEEFCTKYAKTSLDDYLLFLRHT